MPRIASYRFKLNLVAVRITRIVANPDQRTFRSEYIWDRIVQFNVSS